MLAETLVTTVPDGHAAPGLRADQVEPAKRRLWIVFDEGHQ